MHIEIKQYECDISTRSFYISKMMKTCLKHDSMLSGQMAGDFTK